MKRVEKGRVGPAGSSQTANDMSNIYMDNNSWQTCWFLHQGLERWDLVRFCRISFDSLILPTVEWTARNPSRKRNMSVSNLEVLRVSCSSDFYCGFLIWKVGGLDVCVWRKDLLKWRVCPHYLITTTSTSCNIRRFKDKCNLQSSGTQNEHEIMASGQLSPIKRTKVHWCLHSNLISGFHLLQSSNCPVWHTSFIYSCRVLAVSEA